MKLQIHKTLALLLVIFTSLGVFAQKKTFFDLNWKKTKEKKAYYYRIITPEGSMFLVKDYFSRNDQLRTEGRYRSKKMEDDSREGLFTGYWSNGKKRYEGEYKNGKQNGHWTFYYFDGTKKSEGELEKGDYQGEWKFYHKNGQLRTSPKYVDDDRVGLTVYYYDNGEKKEEYNYTKGAANGEFTTYYKGGKMKSKGNYAKDSLDGGYEHYWENGKLSIKGEYSDNKKNGVWEYFHSNGNKSCEVEYKNGKFIKASFFDEEGKKLSKKVYEEDLVKDAEYTGGKDEMYSLIRKQVEKKVDLVGAKKDKLYFIGVCILTLDAEGNVIDREWTLPDEDSYDEYEDPWDMVKNLNSAIDDFPKFQPGKAYNRLVGDTFAVVYILSYKNISIN